MPIISTKRFGRGFGAVNFSTAQARPHRMVRRDLAKKQPISGVLGLIDARIGETIDKFLERILLAG